MIETNQLEDVDIPFGEIVNATIVVDKKRVKCKLIKVSQNDNSYNKIHYLINKDGNGFKFIDYEKLVESKCSWDDIFG